MRPFTNLYWYEIRLINDIPRTKMTTRCELKMTLLVDVFVSILAACIAVNVLQKNLKIQNHSILSEQLRQRMHSRAGKFI